MVQCPPETWFNVPRIEKHTLMKFSTDICNCLETKRAVKASHIDTFWLYYNDIRKYIQIKHI